MSQVPKNYQHPLFFNFQLFFLNNLCRDQSLLFEVINENCVKQGKQFCFDVIWK